MGSIDAMTIAEFLRRLNMEEYASNFLEMKIYYVSDLRHFGDIKQILEEFKIKDIMLAHRMKCMIAGEETAKLDFKYISVAKARQIIRTFISKETDCELIVDCITEDSLTTYQLRDIMC